jgi:hypothetical protein
VTYLPADHAPPMWNHQREEFEKSAHLKERALWWDRRTGKTRVIVDTAAYQYEAGAIDALVVSCFPSAVSRNWAENEVPTYLPVRIPRKVVFWRSGAAGTKWFTEELDDLLKFRGLAVLTFNCEALVRSGTLWKYLQRFCHKRRVMAVADESGGWLSSPDAAVTKRAEALARRAVSRRILDGTPAEEAAFDVFGQCNFLHRGILGYDSAAAFRARYGEYEIERDTDGSPVLDDYGVPQRRQVIGAGGGRRDILIGYRNLPELTSKLLEIGSRVLRSDISDAPPKTYRKARFDLTPAQRRAYDALRYEYRVELDGQEYTALHPLARVGRLAALARGWITSPEEAGEHTPCEGRGCAGCSWLGFQISRAPRRYVDRERNPAIAALTEEFANPVPTLVFCRFRPDVDDALAAARAAGRRAVRYDGSVPMDERVANHRAFMLGEADVAVGTVRAAGYGLPWQKAELLIYYSNIYSGRGRQQSEDRAEQVNKSLATEVVDMIATDTVDEHLVDLLRAKRDVAAEVMGDPKVPWI